MKVRLTIDRVVLEGMNLSPVEGARLERDFRESLHAALIERLRDAGGVAPTGRQSNRERIDMAPNLRTRLAGFGSVLGQAVGARVLPSTESPALKSAGKR